MMNCRICQGETKLHFQTKVLAKYDAEYRYCAVCDHVFAADPHWLAESYSDAIVKTDTDIAVRNLLTALRLAAILYYAFDERGNGTFADVVILPPHNRTRPMRSVASGRDWPLAGDVA